MTSKTTSTQLTLAGYRYSEKDFLTFSQANQLKNASFPLYYHAKKSQLQFNIRIRQYLASWGTLYLSAYQNNYWNYDDTEASYSINYSSRIWDLDYTINYSYTKPDENNQLIRSCLSTCKFPLSDG
ncbi:hypothetical protein E3U36_09810 [Arsenophonus endosymbiont of Aphis craccivora]|nr:hypothetical protein E3U36_09810 [Arsenophonus endosymbiont of Aphis craccivora]